MEIWEFVALFLDEFDVLVANWHKSKKGFSHHDARRLVRTGVINVLAGKRHTKLGRPKAETEETNAEILMELVITALCVAFLSTEGDLPDEETIYH